MKFWNEAMEGKEGNGSPNLDFVHGVWFERIGLKKDPENEVFCVYGYLV